MEVYKWEEVLIYVLPEDKSQCMCCQEDISSECQCIIGMLNSLLGIDRVSIYPFKNVSCFTLWLTFCRQRKIY